MKLLKCLAFEFNIEKMDYYVCLLRCRKKLRPTSYCCRMGFPLHPFICFVAEACSLPNVVDAFICTFCFRAALMIGLKPSGERLMWNRWVCSSEGLPRQVPQPSISAIYLSQCHPFLALPTHLDVSVGLLLMSRLNVLEHALFWGLSFKTLFF